MFQISGWQCPSSGRYTVNNQLKEIKSTEDSDICLITTSEVITWNNALMYCKSIARDVGKLPEANGTLVIIDKQQISDKIDTFLKDDRAQLWIGAKRTLTYTGASVGADLNDDRVMIWAWSTDCFDTGCVKTTKGLQSLIFNFKFKF